MQTAVLQRTDDCQIYPYNRLSNLHHLHASFEILYPSSGEVCVRLGAEERTVSPGEILVIFPGLPHSYVKNERCEGMVMMFTGKMLFDTEEDWSELLPSEPILTLNALDPDVAYCLRRLKSMGMCGKIDETLARAYFSLLFVHLRPKLMLEKTLQPMNDLLYSAMQYMSQNLTQPLSLRGTAHALGVNTYYLSHVLNERLGMGFRSYLNALRIDRARRLLRMSSRSIEDIAAACGFTNLRTFDRVFSERCGATPRDFRKAAAALRSEQLQEKTTP